MFVDPIPILIRVLKARGYEAGVRTPEAYSEVPFVQVGQADGSILEEGYGDHTVIDLSVFAKGYGNARRTALELKHLIYELQATTYPKDDPGGFLFDRSHPVAGPIWVQNENPAITEFLVTADIITRSTTEPAST